MVEGTPTVMWMSSAEGCIACGVWPRHSSAMAGEVVMCAVGALHSAMGTGSASSGEMHVQSWSVCIVCHPASQACLGVAVV